MVREYNEGETVVKRAERGGVVETKITTPEKIVPFNFCLPH